MMLGNGSTSLRMHMVVEYVAPPTPPALPHMATPSTGASMPSEDPDGPHFCPILHLPPLHISQAMLLVASCSPFTMADGRWELGSDIQAVIVKLVGTMMTKLPDTTTYVPAHMSIFNKM